jgi:hypothetical protein
MTAPPFAARAWGAYSFTNIFDMSAAAPLGFSNLMPAAIYGHTVAFIEGCAAIDLDGGLSALGYQLSARIRWGHSLRRVQ